VIEIWDLLAHLVAYIVIIVQHIYIPLTCRVCYKN